MTMNSNIIKPCPVMMTLYSWPLPASKPCPGTPNSRRMNILRDVPIKPAKRANPKYSRPTALCDVVYSQRSKKALREDTFPKREEGLLRNPD